jgi:hypothetical protein
MRGRMVDELPYHAIPEPPAGVRGTAVLARMVDGLGFRLRWATEGLREQDLDFRPGADSMSLRELLHHVARLVAWADSRLGGPAVADQPGDAAAQRAGTLARLAALRERLLAWPDEQLATVSITGRPELGPQPFWSLVNGPLADALTHVGQINAWRRLSGNPAPRADVFRGRPPG